jgi:hypothetical protein
MVLFRILVAIYEHILLPVVANMHLNLIVFHDGSSLPYHSVRHLHFVRYYKSNLIQFPQKIMYRITSEIVSKFGYLRTTVTNETAFNERTKN